MSSNIKRLMAIAAAAALVCALAGCTVQVSKESSSSTSMAASDTSESSSSQSKSSSSSSSAAGENWTAATTADEAAKGAGISSFGVPTRTVIADFVFTNPTFAYDEHVAEAAYIVDGSAELIVRKAEGAHTAPVTAFAANEFSQTWNNTYEGFDVTSHGNAQGAAAICTWNDGTKEYGVTIESLNDKGVTMDAEDLDDIVKAVKAANSGQTASGTAQQASTSVPAFDVAAFVFNNGLGEYLRYYYTTLDGQGCWAIVSRGADGGEYTTYADMQGNIVKSAQSPDYDGADFNVEALVQQYGLGQFQRYYWVQGENGYGYWGIVTTGADGSEITTYVDELGNIIQNAGEIGSIADDSSSAPAFDVENFVFQNGLGKYESYYWVQGSGDTGYWAIVTQGADGGEYTTYADTQGNML